ncbi:acylphosphatase [bacterium]|nr:acylphosphatase [bacterium]
MSSPLICRHILVRGRVQGVGFRAGTRHKAASLGLIGWVHNLPDGDVEIVACGAPAALDQLVSWCRQGPPAARVSNVDVSEGNPPPGLNRFEVR